MSELRTATRVSLGCGECTQACSLSVAAMVGMGVFGLLQGKGVPAEIVVSASAVDAKSVVGEDEREMLNGDIKKPGGQCDTVCYLGEDIVTTRDAIEEELSAAGLSVRHHPTGDGRIPAARHLAALTTQDPTAKYA